MESIPYLIFRLNGSLYGVEAIAVQEVFFLPELTPIAEAPIDIVGVINLRGEILPVMDLHLRFGYRSSEYQLTNSVIVISWERFRLGLIVDQVREVQNISPDEITAELFHTRNGSASEGLRTFPASQLTGNPNVFIAGVARIASDIVMILNHENLIRYAETKATGSAETLEQEEALENLEMELSTLGDPPVFCPNATPEERTIFRERAQNLIKPTHRQDFTGLKPLAVIGLNGEYFGLDLAIVREFTNIRQITPIPCTPSHIVGNMNLRGEILTLLDIRGVLNLPMQSEASRAMVIRVDALVAGVIVNDVFDVMYLNPSEITPVPTAIHSTNDEFLRGTAAYREKMMGILDLPKILTQGGLVVNEEV